MSLTKSELAGGRLGLNAWIALSILPLAAISLAIAAYRSQPGEPARPSGVANTVVAEAEETDLPDDAQAWEETSTTAVDPHGSSQASAATQPMSLAPQ